MNSPFLVRDAWPEGGWSAPRRVEELFDLPGAGEPEEHWRALVPRFEYRVDDLTGQRAEALMARPGPPLVRLATWAALLAELQATPESLEELRVLVHYLLLVGNEAARSATVAMLRTVAGSARTEELEMTIFEEYFQDYIERGRQKGKAETLLQLLSLREVPVDDASRKRILSCKDIAMLDQWVARALKAATVSEVFGPLAQ